MVWERNEEPVQEDSNHETSQMIVDTLADTIYHNRLRVRGREGGKYRCLISNAQSPNYPSPKFRVKGTVVKK